METFEVKDPYRFKKQYTDWAEDLFKRTRRMRGTWVMVYKTKNLLEDDSQRHRRDALGDKFGIFNFEQVFPPGGGIELYIRRPWWRFL